MDGVLHVRVIRQEFERHALMEIIHHCTGSACAARHLVFAVPRRHRRYPCCLGVSAFSLATIFWDANDATFVPRATFCKNSSTNRRCWCDLIKLFPIKTLKKLAAD